MSHIQSINLSKIFINEREVELKSGFTYTLVFIHSRKVLKLKSYRLSKTDKKSMEQYIVFNLNSITKFYTSKSSTEVSFVIEHQGAVDFSDIVSNVTYVSGSFKFVAEIFDESDYLNLCKSIGNNISFFEKFNGTSEKEGQLIPAEPSKLYF